MTRWIGMCAVCLSVALAPAWGMQHNTPGRSASSRYDSTAPAPLVVTEGDPLWRPTRAQLAEWVNAGIQAAAEGMYVPDLPVVQQWMWTFDKPVTTGDGRGVKFMILVSPELGATLAGYAAAWDEGQWEKIQARRDRVVADLAQRLSHEFYGSDLTVAAGMIGGDPGSPTAQVWGAVYYKGEWRGADMWGAGSLESALAGGFPSGSPDARWAVGYLLGQMLDQPALAEPDALSVRLGRWPRRPTEYPRQDFVEAMGDPGLADSTMRLAVGTSAAWAYVDWSLP